MTKRSNGAAKVAPKRASGRNLTDAERAANGWGRITLRLPANSLALLSILAHDSDMTRAEYVAHLLDEADMQHARENFGR